MVQLKLQHQNWVLLLTQTTYKMEIKEISDDVKKAIVDLEEYCQASLNKQFTVTNLTQIQQFVNSVRNGFIDILLDKQSCQEKLAESQNREVESLKKQKQIIIDNLKSKASNVPGKSQSVTSYAEIVKMPVKNPSSELNQ